MRPAGRIPHSVIFYLLFGILLFLLDSRAILVPLHNLVQPLAVPIKAWLYQAKRSMVLPVQVWNSYAADKQKLKQLEQETAGLVAKIVELEGVRQENVHLRKLLGASLPPSWTFSPAKVVAVEGDIAVLTSDYVPAVGLSVITVEGERGAGNAGVFVGRVQEVVGKTVKVLLPTNQTAKIPVGVQGKDGQLEASGLLVGRGGRILLSQVLTREQLGEHDLVVTSGGDNLPPGLLVGKIAKILPVREGAWQEAEVEPALDVGVLDTVFFVTKF